MGHFITWLLGTSHLLGPKVDPSYPLSSQRYLTDFLGWRLAYTNCTTFETTVTTNQPPVPCPWPCISDQETGRHDASGPDQKQVSSRLNRGGQLIAHDPARYWAENSGPTPTNKRECMTPELTLPEPNSRSAGGPSRSTLTEDEAALFFRIRESREPRSASTGFTLLFSQTLQPNVTRPLGVAIHGQHCRPSNATFLHTSRSLQVVTSFKPLECERSSPLHRLASWHPVSTAVLPISASLELGVVERLA
ncbi:hypothetical protein B0J18DRAFT_420548 [Chaetomium sp. MPI-SDFR-AT-0129]|nr:hypothetical protein B0J18DRAFT_420548 [Chaetomium sp. MPI-SDFR-AT-0129]